MSAIHAAARRQDSTMHLDDADLLEAGLLGEAELDVTRSLHPEASLRGTKQQDPTMLLDDGDLLGMDEVTRVERPSRRPSGFAVPPPPIPEDAPLLAYTASGRFLAAVQAASEARIELLEPHRVTPIRLAMCSFVAGVALTLVGVVIAL